MSCQGKKLGACEMTSSDQVVQPYEMGIKNMTDISFQSCVSLAKTLVPPYSSQSPIYRELQRGTKILETEDQLNGYMAYYGEWHRNKISRVLPHVPDDVFNNPFELVDWGCGQGVGLFPVAEYTGEYAENLQRVILIEPSGPALNRAALHAQRLFNEAEIRKVNKRFEMLEPADFTRRIPIPRIHLFSNVLDMDLFQQLDGGALHDFIGMVREYAFGLDEYFLCVSPCLAGVSDRFEKFLTIIQEEERWTLNRLFQCAIANTRPTMAAYVVHYRSKLLSGEKHYTSESKATHLHDLAAANDVDGMGHLLAQGVDVNEPDAFGVVPLLHAAKGDAEEAVRFLLDQGADVNAATPQGATALYYAAKAGNATIMRNLIEHDADLEVSTTPKGISPLMTAIMHKRGDAVRLLLDAGCRMDTRNVRGLSPVKLSEMYATGEILEMLRKRVKT